MGDLKSRVAVSTGIPTAQHRILHRGRELTDDAVHLSSLNFPEDVVLHLATRPRPDQLPQQRRAPAAAAGATAGGHQTTGVAGGMPGVTIQNMFSGGQGGNIFSLFQGMAGAQGAGQQAGAAGGGAAAAAVGAGGGPGVRGPAIVGSFTLGPNGIVPGPNPEIATQIQQGLAQMFGSLGGNMPGGVGGGGGNGPMGMAVPIGFPASALGGISPAMHSGDETLPGDTPVLHQGRYTERSVLQGLDEMLVRLQNGNMESDPGPEVYMATSGAIRRPEVRAAWAQSAATMLRACRAVLRNANLNRETLATVNRIFTAAGLESLPLGVRSFPIGSLDSEEEGITTRGGVGGSGTTGGGGGVSGQDVMPALISDEEEEEDDDDEYYSDEYDHEAYYEDDDEYMGTDSEDYEETDDEEEEESTEESETFGGELDSEEDQWETDPGEGSEIPRLVSDDDDDDDDVGHGTAQGTGVRRTSSGGIGTNSGRGARPALTPERASSASASAAAARSNIQSRVERAAAAAAQASGEHSPCQNDEIPPLLESCSDSEREGLLSQSDSEHASGSDGDSSPPPLSSNEESEDDDESLPPPLFSEEHSEDEDEERGSEGSDALHSLPMLMSDPEDDEDEEDEQRRANTRDRQNQPRFGLHSGIFTGTGGSGGGGGGGRGGGPAASQTTQGTGGGTRVSDAWFTAMRDEDLILVAAVTVGELARRFMRTMGQETAPVGVNAMIMRLATRLRSLSSLDGGRREIAVSSELFLEKKGKKDPFKTIKTIN